MFVVRLLLFLLIPLYACAPLSETEQYEQENRLILAKEEYAQRAEYCQRNGGSMSMTARTIGQPDYFDYKSAQCTERF